MHRVTSKLVLAIMLGGVAALCIAVEPKQESNVDTGRFSTVEIVKGAGLPYALEVRLDGKGKAVGLFSPESKEPRTYFNDAGMLYTNGWIIISGVYTGTGEGYNIEPPSKDTSMLAIWSDVLGPAVQVRAANAGPESYLFQAWTVAQTIPSALSRTANCAGAPPLGPRWMPTFIEVGRKL